jgi:hypothetical protein
MADQKVPLLKGEQKTLGVDAIAPNPWNPNVQSEFKFNKELDSIREFGFIDPVTVRSGRLKGPLFPKPEIIDGEHRWKAAKALGMPQVLVLDIGRVSDEKAKVLTDILNNLRGENDPLKWHAMVQSVADKAPELLDLLPYKREELDAMLMSANVDWDELDELNADHHANAQRDNDGKLFKKFSVSVPESTMAQAQDLIRKIKAAYKLDNDAAAFKVLLDHAAGALAPKRQSAPPPPVEAPPKRRRVKPVAAE